MDQMEYKLLIQGKKKFQLLGFSELKDLTVLRPIKFKVAPPWQTSGYM